MIKLKLDKDAIQVLITLCIGINQVVNELMSSDKKLDSQMKYKAELFEVNIVKDKLSIQEIKMRNTWSRKTINFRLSPIQSYLLIKYLKSSDNPYKIVVTQEISKLICRQLINL